MPIKQKCNGANIISDKVIENVGKSLRGQSNGRLKFETRRLVVEIVAFEQYGYRSIKSDEPHQVAQFWF